MPVLNSTMVYVEVPTCLLPTMMALAAKGTQPSSIYQPETLSATTENTEVWRDWSGSPYKPPISIVTPIVQTLTYKMV